MKRFFVDKIIKPTMRLTGDEQRHFAEVLRGRVGDRVVLCPNDGVDYVYRAVSFDKTSVVLEYESESVNETETTLDLTVFQALLKGDKTELVVQKLTELGVRKISPFVSEFTVQKSEKTERLVRAAHEAAKQCGRAVIPTVTGVLSFEQMLATLGQYEVVVFAYEGAYANGRRLDEIIKGNDKKVALIVGPEGGFSQDEVRALNEEGYESVTLGKRILRAETASIAGTAVIMQLAGEWK